jgi:hypothetical protein
MLTYWLGNKTYETYNELHKLKILVSKSSDGLKLNDNQFYLETTFTDENATDEFSTVGHELSGKNYFIGNPLRKTRHRVCLKKYISSRFQQRSIRATVLLAIPKRSGCHS